jgi:ribosomal protein S18 acetylase RimI-like enzyme
MPARPLRQPSQDIPLIRALTPDDVPALRLRGERGLNDRVVRAVLESYPGRSVWIPETVEFALLAPWRHRDDIGLVQELDAVEHAEALIAGAIEGCREAGAAMVLVIEMDELRRQGFYRRAGLEQIEEVITYELDRPRAISFTPGSLAFSRVAPADAAAMAELLRLDHAAFPWLWWNTEAEFAAYAETTGVQLYLARKAGEAIAYLGLTSFLGWGHLDRIAVVPGVQGQGYGRQALAFAVDRLARNGARRVALSTQRANLRSQRLYERAGFRRSRGFDYRLYGAVLRPPAPGLATNEQSASMVADPPSPPAKEG